MDRNATRAGASNSEYVFKLWNLIIRPPRSTYDASRLGPTEFIAGGIRAARRDVKIRTARGSLLECSHFVPRQAKDVRRKFPVVIYLHGNASSRLEAFGLVGSLISQNISLFCFDAAGCGLSEGEYISLGWHEKDDLAAVVRHLRQSPYCGPIGLWGRSMGAATALMYADRDPDIGAICIDSAFSSLRVLVEELARSDRFVIPVPTWLLDAAIAFIRIRVLALAEFDIDELVPLDSAKKSLVPALFLHARGDTFISLSHSEKLHESYPGPKEFLTFDGDHNTTRTRDVSVHVVDFFRRQFRLDEIDLKLPCKVDCDEDASKPPLAALPRPSMFLPRQGSTYEPLQSNEASKEGDTSHKALPIQFMRAAALGGC